MKRSSPLCKILDTEIARILPQAIAIRQHIHAHPELSGAEYATARLLFDTLKKAGIKARYFLDKTAVTGVIGAPGKTVVLRADLDALAQIEQNAVSFKSMVPGVMHACGHDMHAAMLIGAALVLHAIGTMVEGTVVVLFQPHEEKEPGGARRLIQAGAFPADTDAVFGLHVSSELTCGTVGIKSGAECAAVFDFDIVIYGKGGHGAAPQRCIDPIICAAAVVTALQTLISRENNPFQPAVLTVGMLHSGTSRNIIPDSALLRGTVRTFSEPQSERLKIRIRQMATSIAQAFGARAATTIIPSYPAGFNDVDLTEKCRTILRDNLGTKAVIDLSEPVMFAEDFAYYQKKAPGVLLHLGVRPPKQKNMPPLHAPDFLPDENAIKTGILTHCFLAIETLKSEE